MRLIDADALKIDIACVYGSNPKYLNWLNNAPTVDAVPVIRRKDCKWYEKDFGCDWGVCFHNDWTVGYVGNGVDSDGYCYRAERKDNGAD